jgi:hypothetical protein
MNPGDKKSNKFGMFTCYRIDLLKKLKRKKRKIRILLNLKLKMDLKYLVIKIYILDL